MTILQNKNVRQLVCHLYVDTAVEGSELYCYNQGPDFDDLKILWKLSIKLL